MNRVIYAILFLLLSFNIASASNNGALSQGSSSSGGGSSLPTATAAGQAPVSTGSGTNYTAQPVGAANKYIANFNGTTFAGSTTSAAITITTLPANASLVGQRISTITAFTASGLTSMSCSIGDASNHVRYSAGATLDVSQTVTATSALWDGGLTNSTLASNAIILYCTSTGANLSTLSAGQIEIVLDIVTEPTTSTTIQ